MNERIEKIAKEHGFIHEFMSPGEKNDALKKYEKFAELIVQECKENFAKVWYEQGLDIQGNEIGKFMTRFDKHFGVEE